MFIRSKVEYLQVFKECDYEVIKIHYTLKYDPQDPDMSQCDMFALKPKTEADQESYEIEFES